MSLPEEYRSVHTPPAPLWLASSYSEIGLGTTPLDRVSSTDTVSSEFRHKPTRKLFWAVLVACLAL
jgi:hypothetical protein